MSCQDELAQPNINRSELGRRIAYPEREDRAFDVEALSGQHLGLPIERSNRPALQRVGSAVATPWSVRDR